jgi:hypothetical protein
MMPDEIYMTLIMIPVPSDVVVNATPINDGYHYSNQCEGPQAKYISVCKNYTGGN